MAALESSLQTFVKKIIEKSADEPHAVELLLHGLLNLRLVRFPPGHDA